MFNARPAPSLQGRAADPFPWRTRCRCPLSRGKGAAGHPIISRGGRRAHVRAPPRRSGVCGLVAGVKHEAIVERVEGHLDSLAGRRDARFVPDELAHAGTAHAEDRSEEHKSELQSLMHNSYAVFVLKK